MLAALAALFTSARANANFAPLARASANPEEALVGQPIAFSSAASIDPDAGPQPLTFVWDFGDGASSTAPLASHAYTAPGSYDVILTASDGLASGLDTLTVYVLPMIAAGRAVESSPIVLSEDGTLAWVVNRDSGSVSVLDTTALTKLHEADVCADPQTLALAPDGVRLFVVCRGAGELRVLDRTSLATLSVVLVGHQPHGVLVVPSTGTVVVSNHGDDNLTLLSADGSATTAVVDVADGPRALALAPDGRTLYVSHFLTRASEGLLTVVDLQDTTVAVTVSLSEDTSPDTTSSGSGFPNLLGALAVHPAGQHVWYGGLKSNTSRGSFVSGAPLVATNRVRGMMGRVEVATALDQPMRRIDTNNADSVSAIAFSPLGRFAYAAHPGIGAVSVYDLLIVEQHDPSDGSTVPFAARIDVCEAPDGLALSSDGTRLYVACPLSRAVAVLDVGTSSAAQLLDTVPVTAEPLAPDVALGKKLFTRSRAPVHSSEGYIACASCHPDGGSDGRTWDFSHSGEGLRNTIDLRGRGGMDHGPVHWSANFDEIQDFENDIVHGFGGEGLAQDGEPPHPPLDANKNGGRSAELDALAAYVATLRAFVPLPPTPAPDADALVRGRALFFDPVVGCAVCHPPPRYTDSVLTANPQGFVLHDVGTLGAGSGQRLGGMLTGLDTPTLIGSWDGAPYLHDGSAASVRDVLTTHNAADRHGVTSHLGEGDIDALEAFVLSLDQPGEALEATDDMLWPAGGCRCRSASADGGASWWNAWLMAAALGAMRRAPRVATRRSRTRRMSWHERLG